MQSAQVFMQHFYNLSASRRAGFTALPIPISEILAYCELHRIDDLDYRELLTRRIQAMDEVYMKVNSQKKEKKKRRKKK